MIKKDIYREMIFYAILLILIVITNKLFFAPHCNDFPGLAAICNIMDENVLFCVNNNWGFMVPLLAYLLNFITGNLLISQRIFSGLGCIFLLYTMLHIMKKENYTGKEKSIILLFFAVSPWLFDSILSMHFDAISVSIIILFTYKALKEQRKYLLYGFFIAISFWFRFHFLVYSLLFPVIILIGTRKFSSFIKAGIGVMISLAIPHILTYLAYNQASLGNQKFIIAQFLGVADWSYDFSLELEKMSIKDIVSKANLISSLVWHTIWFFENILFFVIIVSFINFKKFLKKPVFYVFTAVSIFILMFLFIRGYTTRLTLGLIIPLLLLIPKMEINTVSKKLLLLISLIIYIMLPQAQQMKKYYAKIQEHHYIYDKITQTIDFDNTAENSILALGEMYNFSDRNLEFSENVQDGWIVRFAPVMERYELIDIHNIYHEDVLTKIKQYDYVIQKKTDFNYKELDLGKEYDIAYSDNIIDIFEKRSNHTD